MLIIVATLPLAAVLPVKDYVEGLYSNTVFIGCALLVTGFVLFFSDRLARGHKSARSATLTDAVLVGLAQAVAVVPGVSRSGATISAGMMRGFDRNFAVRFSFLMSLPAVLGANIIALIGAVKSGFDTALLPIYLVGVAVAMVSGLLAISLVKMLADKGKFGRFAYYCWAVGVVALAASFFTRA
ncbi:Undecaprenyl-diphosphatase [bioreactor metagenome]|uniref:Undecaprenyl-diphosphatase n=1 Tax=bioreactor metagenome TaxID=1076179 RepID=A0A645HIQ0_9ZZZZ